MRKLIKLYNAFLSLKRRVGYASAFILTMGISIGALLSVLTLSYILFVKTLPYDDQDKLFVAKHIQLDKDNIILDDKFSYESLMNVYRSKGEMDNSSLIYYAFSIISSHPQQPLVNTVSTDPNYFKLFSVPMAIGRSFQQTEQIDLRNPVAVISYDLWKEHFNKDEKVLEEYINIGNVSYKIIGVTADKFKEPQIHKVGQKTQVWLTWDVSDSFAWAKNNWKNTFQELVLVGKLGKNQSKNQVEQSLSNLIETNYRKNNIGEQAGQNKSNRIELKSVHDVILGESKSIVFLMIVGVIGLVLIASTNVSNLFMSRIAEQHRQYAIRATLGANKKHLFKDILNETLVLMTISLIVALLAANFGLYILREYLVNVFPRATELSINAVTLLSASIVTIGFALFFAKLGTSVINYESLNTVLQSSGKGTGLQVSSKTRSVLIIAQVAVASLLITVNLSLFREASEPLLTAKGVKTTNVYELFLPVSSLPFPSANERIVFTQELRTQLLQLPQVEMVSHSDSSLDGSRFGAREYQLENSSVSVSANTKLVDHQYFQLLNQPLLTGRYFSESDILNENKLKTKEITVNSNPVVVINETLANQLGNSNNVVGLSLTNKNNNPTKIIGVVKDVVYPTKVKSEPRVFFPANDSSFRFLIKFRNANIVNREIIVDMARKINPKFSVYEYDSMTQKKQKMMFKQTTTSYSTATLSIVVLFLSGVGLYGIISYSTQMRRFEIGTRMAIGAKKKDLVSLVFKDNLSSISKGFAFGFLLLVTVYFLFTGYLKSYLSYEVAISIAISILAITATVLFACYWPLTRYMIEAPIKNIRGAD